MDLVRGSSTTARRSRTRLLLAPLVALTALSLAACGGSAPSTSPSGEVDPHAPEESTVTGVMYQNAVAVQFLAAAAGPAEDFGLTLKPSWMTDGAAGVSQVVSGEVDFGQFAPARIVDAVNQGIDLEIVAGTDISSENFVTVETLPSSGVTTLKDMAGKTVAFPSPVGSQANRMRVALADAGVDPESVTFVQLPFGDIPGALQRGDIQAGAAQGASLTDLRGLGSTTVFDTGGGQFEGRIETVWAGTRDFIEKNPNTVAAFQCSMLAGSDIANGSREAAEEVFKRDFGWDDKTIAATVEKKFLDGAITDDKVSADYHDLSKIGEPATDFDVMSIVVPLPDNC